MFNHCSSTTDGGSVFFYCQQEGEFVQTRTCYYKSISKTYQMAFKQWVIQPSTYKNYARVVSVYNCGNSKGSKTVSIISGYISSTNINITNNQCTQHSSYFTDLRGSQGKCGYSTFRGNNQTHTNSFFFGDLIGPFNQTVSYCNIIENKCGTNDNQVLFYCWCTTNVDHCIFFKEHCSLHV